MATEYGSRLKKARTGAGMTQAQLSTKTGISQSTISTAERQGNGSGETPVYAQACGVDALWLATGKGEMHLASSPSAPAAPPSPFLTAQDRRRPLPLAELLAQLAVLLDAVDAPTRDNAALMLSSFANKPEGRASSTSSLVSMLEPDALKKDTPAQQPQSMSSGAR
jgi:transcriptional regulator with XRE-family HTH domain